MAKFIMTFENNITEKELTLAGRTFSYRMIQTEDGKKSDKKCFEHQVQEAFGEMDERDLEAVSSLSFGDEYAIEEALEILSAWEEDECE